MGSPTAGLGSPRSTSTTTPAAPATSPTTSTYSGWGGATGVAPSSTVANGRSGTNNYGITPFSSDQSNGDILGGMQTPPSNSQTSLSGVGAYNTAQSNSPNYASTYGLPSTHDSSNTGMGNGNDAGSIAPFNSAQTNGQILDGLQTRPADLSAQLGRVGAFGTAQINNPNNAAIYGFPASHDLSNTGLGSLGTPSAAGGAPGRAAGLYGQSSTTPAATPAGPDPTLSWDPYHPETQVGNPTPEQEAAWGARVRAQVAANNANSWQQMAGQNGVNSANPWAVPQNYPMPANLLAQLSPEQQMQFAGQVQPQDPAMAQAIQANRVAQLYGSPLGGMTQSALANPYAQFASSQPQNPNYGNNQLIMLLNLLSALGLGNSQNQFGNQYNPMFTQGGYGNLLGNNTRYY